jgi:hypothetical protein
LYYGSAVGLALGDVEFTKLGGETEGGEEEDYGEKELHGANIMVNG